MSGECRFGRREGDRARRCFEHGGFLEYMSGYRECDQVKGRQQQTYLKEKKGSLVREVAWDNHFIPGSEQ